MRRKIILFSVSILALWGILLSAAKLAEHLLNRKHHAPTADTVIQQITQTPDDSLPVYWKVPSFSFPDQDGLTVRQSDLLGKVWVADFIFTQCVTACPIMTSKLIILQKQVTDPAIRFVSFSVDPDHDTSAALKAYAELWHGDQARWRVLRTEPAALTNLTRDMRVTLAPGDDRDNPIIHSSLFFLIDTQGMVRGLYNSTDSDAMDQMVRDINTLTGTTPPSPVPTTAAVITADGSAVSRGKVIYNSMGCLACHSQSRIAPPLAKVFGSAVQLADHRAVWADEAYLHESITDPAAKVVNGYLPTMPSYRQLLSDAQMGDVIAYLKSIGSGEPAGHGVIAAASTAPAPGQELLVTDAVCKMQVHVDPTAPRAEYRGRVYYFCSQQCLEKFEKDPAKYANAIGAAH